MTEQNLSAYLLQKRCADKWKEVGLRRRAGILVPLFSVFSKKSLGIGELEDLKLLVDWCVQTGLSVIQLLPLNELGATFCPYDALSSFALEPAYLSLRSPPYSKHKSIQEEIKSLKDLFTCGASCVDYRIKGEKSGVLWQMFNEEDVAADPGFKQFCRQNVYWLDDFALFLVLKKYHGGLPWYEWENRYKDRNKASLEDFRQEHGREITFSMWLQWELYKQLKGVKDYARSKNVLMKGDLPMLVSRDSADVWSHPEFFKLGFASGAPPDVYCAKGQRWGMPPYNWGKIAEDGYLYLREKLRYAENFYDILRIDHVVGLFRIWSIPYNEPRENQGLHGAFDPAEEQKWAGHGINILSVILDNTDMLLCAEDLGIIPRVCTEALEQLGIPGNDVQRWVKDWKVKHDFLSPLDYRVLSVAMLSTHDTTNWPAWWENEAGTIDEALFIRKCSERAIDYASVKEKLFEPLCCRHNRLRWLSSISSAGELISILGRRKEELEDFVDLYENSYREKEKLWKHLGLTGPMREEADPRMLEAALKLTLNSSSVFCIETIVDWLSLGNIFKGDPYQYRINTPGTTSPRNWSLVVPIPLEDLLKHKVCAKIKGMVVSSARA
ncbi:MAG: 4-alpha-glucanotransferase [Candidatus Omnitrophica bacterium]|nr:4-alpha-glucanotransferase [Candidatus Omnitrophota bacterium]